MQPQFVEAKRTTLFSPIIATDTTIVLTNLVDLYGNALAMADFGSVGYITLDPGGDSEEIASFTAFTVATNGNATLTGVTRALLGKSPYTGGGTATPHYAGTIIVVSNNPQLYNGIITYAAGVGANNAFTGLNTFVQNPQKTTSALATINNQFITKNDLLAATLGSVVTNQLLISATSGEALTIGKIAYLKSSDGKWYNADSSTASKSVGVQLGIPQATVAGGSLAVNILLSGIDSNQSGLTAGTSYYLSTSGAISTAAGTYTRFIGIAESTTTLLVNLSAESDPLVALSDSSRVYGVDTGAANAYIITTIPTFPVLKAGQEIAFLVTHTNTTTSTATVNGSAALTMKRGDGSNLIAGDLLLNEIAVFRYDGTNLEMMSPSANLPITSSSISAYPQVVLTAAESITAGQHVAFGYYQADGGVTFDAKSASNATASSISTAFTVAVQTNRILIVTIANPSGQTITAITYGGAAMTLAKSQTNINTYYLIAPATGSNTFAVSFSGSTTYAYDIRSYYNVKQTGQPDASINGTVSNPNLTLSLTPVLDGSLLYFATNFSNGSGSQPTSCSGLNNNTSFSNSGAVIATIYAGDMGVSVPAAAVSVTLVPAGGSNLNTMNGVGITLAPATAPTYGYAVLSSSGNVTSYTHPSTIAFRYIAYAGVALTSASATQSVTIQVAGVVSNQSGLTPLQQYYLADTNGTIGKTAGTNSKKIGIALSATQLLVTNIW